MNRTYRALLLAIFLIIFPLNLMAQPFVISSSGEMDLDTDLVTSEGQVNKYFGMYVDGIGDSIIRVRIGEQSSQKEYEFKLSSTRIVSYLLAQDFVRDTSIAFRRGVVGQIEVDILDASGALQDTKSILLDVDFGKKNCKKHPSKNLKRCTQLNLAKASNSQRKLFAKQFVKSMKGPIILEP